MVQVGKKRNSNRTLVGKTLGKYPLGKPRKRLEDNMKKDLEDI
jgi:hypothetical protein